MAGKLGAIDGLELINDGSRFPIVGRARRTASRLDLTLLSQLLRERGWIVPAYTLPPNAEHITVLRMVVKENFSRDMVDMLAHDVRAGDAHARPRACQRAAHEPAPPALLSDGARPARSLPGRAVVARARLTSRTAPTITITTIRMPPAM